MQEDLEITATSQQSIEGYWLSPQQRRLWKLRRNASASALHAQCAVRVSGSSDPSVLRRAVERVISRHEALRTGFRSLPGMEAPIQVISEEAHVAWHEVDLRGMGERERQDALAEIMRRERRLGSEIEGSAGAVRAIVAATGEDERVIVVSMSALVGDTRTLVNLVGELCAGCAVEMGGAEREKDATDGEIVQYAQFSEWQNQLIQEGGSAGREYWREVRRKGDEELKLPLEGKKPEGKHEEPEWEEVEIDEELRRGVEREGREQGVSEEAVLLACWQALLARLTGKREISVSVLLHGRGYEEMRQAFGLYARWPPVRGVYYDEFSFSEALSQLNKTLQEAYEWQEYFVGEQIEDQGAPLITSLPIGFEYQSWPSPCPNSALSFSLLDLFSSSDLFKLRLCLAASPRFLRARFFFDSRRFSRHAVRLLASQFISVLRGVVGNPRCLVGELDVLSDEERGLLLSQSRRQARDYPTALPLELFEQWAARAPQEVAVECGERKLSFAELDRLARSLSRRLREMGAGPDQRVALLLERSVEMVAAALGVWKAGAAYVPLDLSQPETRIAAVIRDAGAVAVLSSRAVMERVNLSGRGAPVILVEDVDERQDGEEWMEPPAPVEMSGDELAYLIYTSGTTGQAKGVMVRHSSVANLIWALEEAVYAKQGLRRVSVNAPLAFDSSVKQLAQVCRGRTLVVVPEDVRPDPRLLVSYLREKEVELLDSTPSQLRALLEAGLEAEAAAPGREGGQGGALRAVLVGGEAIDEALWRRLAGGRLAFYNVYGPTECTVDATCEPIRDECDGPYLGSAALGNMEVYVVDERQRPAPAGIAGELYVGGAGVARGYRGDAGKTAEKFIPDWLSGKSGARLYRTGDLARVRDDGRIEYVGRGDGQVKIRGYRVEVGEIEAALMSHGSVREAVVAAREAEDGEKRLVAYVVGAEVEIGELRRLLRERLPEYMVPGCIAPLDKMPLTRNGKIDRRALPDPGEILDSDGAPSAAEEAQTPYHEMLIDIWRQALGVSQVGIDDSFFDLGGHSLLATQLMSRVGKAFGIDVALRVLFDRPTVRRLGEVIEETVRAGHGVAAPPLVPVERGRELPLSFAQQRLWFLNQLEPGKPYYNCPVAVRMKGQLDVGALERTLQEVMRRHESLRTRFPAVNGQPSQEIQSEVESRLPVVDISELETERMEREAERLAREEGDRAFDLSLGPMLRATLVRMGEDEYVVLFIMHHIVSDAWSKSVLVREVVALYKAFIQGRPSPLPELPIQYADYAVWQREWLQGEALEKQLAYWRERLGGKLPTLELPTDRPRPAALSYHGARHTFMLEEGLTAGLKELSRSSGTTLFMTLLAGFKTLLCRETGQEDLLIGTAIAGRNRSETEGLIGFFINTLALRTDLSGAPKFTDLLAQVKNVALGAYAHQDLPFDKLVEDLQPERSASRAPIVQITFGLRNAPKTELELPGLTFSALGIEREMGRYDVTLWMSEVGGQLSGTWTYMTELYDLETIKRLTGHFETLLQSIVAQPEARLHTLEILTEAEKQELDLKKQRRQVPQADKLKGVKRKSIGVSSELPEECAS